MIGSREIEPTVKRIIFLSGDPTVLPDILAVRFLPYYRQHLLFEIAVGAVV
jgi:hypothetical protein